MSSTDVKVLHPLLSPQPLKTVLTVAGSDSSGGAGIEADIKAITANGAYALTAITALTAQNTKGVERITLTDEETLEAIFNANFSDIQIDAIKTGILTSDSVEILSKYLNSRNLNTPLVIDPVLVSTSGSQLTKTEVLRLVINKLFQKATLITPNLIEAQEIQSIFGPVTNPKSTEDMKILAKSISLSTGAQNVLVKGGHSPWISDAESYVTDVLYSSSRDSYTIFRSDYIISDNTHGTGCTLASSIAANLAKGISLDKAVEYAIQYVHGAILSASKIGHGNGPLNHVYNIISNDSNSFREGSFVDFLINHPTVKPVWDEYVNHPFVAKVGDGTLPSHQFLRYLGQDYPYLINYAKIHSLAASVAPDLNCLNREIEILNEIKHELGLHTEKLKRLGVTDFNSFKMSSACQEYADYLLNVAKSGDWLEINVSLAPCLIGYMEAANNVEAATDNKDYKDWLASYKSDWYARAVRLGKETIDHHSDGISYEKALKLVKIFGDITLLEVKFWDDSLAYQEDS